MNDEFFGFSETKTGADGKPYSVRYLLTREELAGLQDAGLVGSVDEIVSIQHAVDIVVASAEMVAALACGALVQ